MNMKQARAQHRAYVALGGKLSLRKWAAVQPFAPDTCTPKLAGLVRRGAV